MIKMLRAPWVWLTLGLAKDKRITEAPAARTTRKRESGSGLVDALRDAENHMANGSVHWTFWIIGTVALIWNLMGCMNFIMQMNADALAGYSEAARTLVEGRPAWATVGFAVAVFGGAAGCLLLLLRKYASYYAFVASLLGVMVTLGHTIGMADSTFEVPVEIWVGTLMSLVVAALLVWYSKRAQSKGWLS